MKKQRADMKIKRKQDIRLKGKINIRFIILTIFAIAVTTVLSTIVFYELFKTEIMRDLKTYTHVLKSTGVFEYTDDLSKVNLKNEDLRVTLVSEQGDVLYDNMVTASDMTNHVDRPEIETAFAKGEGQAVRLSETLNRSTFYYAVLLDNGYVLRVSKESDSVWSVLFSGIPYMLGIMAVLLVLTVVFTHYLTKSIVKPIEQMANNMNHADELEAYKEIRPFIDTIKQQHENILQNAQMRQEFTANVSHELKTPLTSISGYSELIENGMAGDEDVRRFAAEIHRNSNRLLTLINDIIRLSELDVVEDTPVMEKVDLYGTARITVDMLAVHAKKHEVTLSIEGESAYILANRVMMEEIVYNLTDNAIRYNNQGGEVNISVYNHEEQVILSVKDTGIGIPIEHQEQIFQRFYRVDKSRSKLTGGTGLGLAIVKHIVAKHDAKIGIVSEPGKGTEITVTFDSYEMHKKKSLAEV